ncbi:hypothetical protein ACBQ21_13025 [Pseudomonas putida]|uniref:hypothetical protein n=1 Tax=Pseudomonas putida TaxID=303 RepID=UPI003526211D
MINEEQQQILDAINELVPQHLHSYLEGALSANGFDFDRAGLLLTGELNPSATTVQTSVIKREGSLWLGIQSEIYDFLCTSSSTYKKERAEAGVSLKNIIAILATSVAAKFHIALGIASGIVTLAIIAAFKLTKNAWCKIQKEKTNPKRLTVD